MIDFNIDTNELASGLTEEIEKQIEKINFTAIYRGIGEVLQTAVEDNFESEGAYFGKKWDGLKASTIQSRKRKGKWPGSILQVTGRLRSSFTYSLSGNTLSFGTNVKYAKYLDPKRPLFSATLTEEMKDEIRSVIVKSLG